MVIIKNNYYLYIENLTDIDINTLKITKKFNIILRSPKNNQLNQIIKFRKKCKSKKIKFFIANNSLIAQKSKADGLYISSYNKKKYYINIEKIGSAHNLKEINEKIKQNCNSIIVSRLFKTNYKNKKFFLNILKFNLLKLNTNKNLIPLGGINFNNFLKLRLVNCTSFAILSAIKKKPAISSWLF